MPGPGARVRIVEDDIVVVRYSELRERVAHGHGAEQIAKSLGLSPAAIIFHLHKMGVYYNRREGVWQHRQ
jgi:DNA-binding NarL/FixJ family response regulator